MKKKLISLATAICLVTTSIFGGVTGIAYGADSLGFSTEELNVVLEPVESEGAQKRTKLSQKSESKAEAAQISKVKTYAPEVIYTRDPETGYISASNENEVPQVKAGEAGAMGRATYIPSAYPTGGISTLQNTYPATRSQNPYGTCWAFSATACAEFDLIKNHGYNRNLDLSELQLAYFTYHTGMDRMENLQGDQNIYQDSVSFLDHGGNLTFASRALAQWKGFAYESEIPYSSASSAAQYGLSGYLSYANSGAKLESADIIDIKNNPNGVKEAIMNYGAVSASYYSDTGSDYTVYYNTTYNSYYYPYAQGTNHVVTIVGWDDNFSMYNFNYRPSKNGAWLVRNSWTTETGASLFSYFWLSYADPTLANSVYSLDFAPGNRYNHNYQHDGTISAGSLQVEKVANVFTARNMDNAGSEALEAVVISMDGEANVSYQVDVYTGLKDKTDPESGYHHSYATTTAKFTYPGIHRVYLKSKVYIAPGETFSVVVTSRDGRRYFDSERTENFTYVENGVNYAWFKSISHADPGESFYKGRSSDTKWVDCATDAYNDYGNLRIKAFTTNSSTKKYTVSYKLNGGKVASGNPAWYLSTSGSTTLKTPTREGYHFLGWYTDSNYTNKITKISGSLGRNLTLYAKWAKHSYKETVVKKATATQKGLLRQTCTGCSLSEDYHILVPKASLAYTKTTYSSKAKKPSVTVKTSNGKLSSNLYKVTYSNNVKVGRGKVTIKMSEKYYKAAFTKRFSIVPKAPASTTAKLSGDYNNVKVTWKKSTGADGYYVYYKKASASKYSTKNRIATTKLSKTFKNLKNGVKYTFKVVPYFKSGDTKYTSIKYKTATATTLKKLKQPSIKRVSGGKVSLKWQCISGASGYQVYWAASKKGKYKKLCDYSSKYNGVTFSVGKGEPYWYKTRAYKKVNGKKIYGPWSDAKKFTR